MTAWHDVLTPFGPQSSAVSVLWWIALWTASAVYVLTMAALARAAWRRRERDVQPGEHGEAPTRLTHRATWWVGGATGITVLLLFAFLVADLVAARRLTAIERPAALTIRVTGLQWWWRAVYQDTVPSQQLSTANEIHIPVGVPVQLELETGDVIHSFWVPALGGKRDLLPHHRNRLWLQADRPGRYRGQCAEFCGVQHARMAFEVVALPRDAYRAWYAKALAPLDTLSLDARAAAGRRVFERSACALCHTVRGTPAGGSVGPELTHVASRRTIAAGVLPNTAESLARWIADPQRVKPGTRMPPTPLSADDRRNVVAYLQQLR